ncbi:FkbM family methyltransferase [Phenylobacterium sp. LjRoot219]|uniref:FkbM family methyltransferase n=1 Tax=Phenylobacterium sp. LjRoot219 TaxID=3342283 RepID=UPI003ECDDAFB
MTLEQFIARREAERAWAFANGYNNGDPATNGEYACLDALLAEADAFVDVGANEGLFLARAAARTPAPRILAFEPNPAHAALITEQLAGAGRLEGVALGDKPGSAILHVHATHHATASLTDRPRMSPRFRAEMSTVEVPLRRLDDYAADLGDARKLLIKIDAEGFEFPVIRGAERLLAQTPACAVMFEHSFAWLETGEPLLGCFQAFDALGFDFFRILPVGLEHVRFFANDMERAQYCNYVAIRGFDLLVQPTVPLPTVYGETTLRLF